VPGSLLDGPSAAGRFRTTAMGGERQAQREVADEQVYDRAGTSLNWSTARSQRPVVPAAITCAAAVNPVVGASCCLAESRTCLASASLPASPMNSEPPEPAAFCREDGEGDRRRAVPNPGRRVSQASGHRSPVATRGREA